jgi:hypothetical protein
MCVVVPTARRFSQILGNAGALISQRTFVRKPTHILLTSKDCDVIMIHEQVMAKMCAAAIAIGCCGASVSAQTIYKQIDAAGRTTYTDRPAADSVVTTSPYPKRGPASPPRIAKRTRSDVSKALFSSSAVTSIYAATVDFNEATRRSGQARQSRQEGIEPQLGERTGNAGTSAMSARYQRRQRKLEREVVVAELRMHETSLVRSALARSIENTVPSSVRNTDSRLQTAIRVEPFEITTCSASAPCLGRQTSTDR